MGVGKNEYMVRKIFKEGGEKGKITWMDHIFGQRSIFLERKNKKCLTIVWRIDFFKKIGW